MNAGSHCIAEDLLETYAWGRLSEPESASLEEHLLLCAGCQNRLEQLDDYLRVATAAAAALESACPVPVADAGQNTLRLSRPTVNLAVSATAITAITPA